MNFTFSVLASSLHKSSSQSVDGSSYPPSNELSSSLPLLFFLFFFFLPVYPYVCSGEGQPFINGDIHVQLSCLIDTTLFLNVSLSFPKFNLSIIISFCQHLSLFLFLSLRFTFLFFILSFSYPLSLRFYFSILLFFLHVFTCIFILY